MCQYNSWEQQPLPFLNRAWSGGCCWSSAQRDLILSSLAGSQQEILKLAHGWGVGNFNHPALSLWASSSDCPRFGRAKALAKLVWLFLLLLGILVFSEYCVVFAFIYQSLYLPSLLSGDWAPTIFWVFSQRLLIPDLILFWTVFILSLFSRPFLQSAKMNLEYNPSFQLCLQCTVSVVHYSVPSRSSMKIVNSTKPCLHQLDASFHFENKHKKSGLEHSVPPIQSTWVVFS